MEFQKYFQEGHNLGWAENEMSRLAHNGGNGGASKWVKNRKKNGGKNKILKYKISRNGTPK